MALALLRHAGGSRDEEIFDIHIGENRYYRLRVGHEGDVDENGFAQLGEVVYQGPVQGPLPESRRGRQRVRLPLNLFDEQARWVQLVSARKHDGTGVTSSELVQVRTARGTRLPSSGSPHPSRRNIDAPLRKLADIRRNVADENRPPDQITVRLPGGTRTMSVRPLRTQPASRLPNARAYSVHTMQSSRHRPRLYAGKISEAAGIGAIASLITTMLPQVIDTIKGLSPAIEAMAPTVNKLISGLLQPSAAAPAARAAPPMPVAAPATGSPAMPQPSSDAEVQRLMVQLLQQAIAAMPQGANAVTGTTPASSSPSPAGIATEAIDTPSTTQGLRTRARGISQRHINRGRGISQGTTHGITLSARRGANPANTYPGQQTSQAMVLPAIPALMAVLPALAPLLQNVLNPQTIQSVISQPTKHLGTIINGLKDFMKLGIQSHEQDLSHLRALTPGVDDPALDALLASLSLGLSQSAREEPHYKRAASVTLDILPGPTVDVRGSDTAAYLINRDWGIDLSIQALRHLPGATIHVVLKDAETLEILIKGKGPSGDLPTGPLAEPIAIPAESTRVLDPGRQYLLCVHVVWKNSKGEKRGTSIQQQIVALGDYAFERIAPRGEVVALADPQEDRNLWHNIWSGDFDRDRRRFRFDIRYRVRVALDGDATERRPARLTLDDEDSPNLSGRIDSGMVISMSELIRLRQTLQPDAPPLSREQESAIRSSAFLSRMRQVASTNIDMSGRNGKKGALWCYLGVRLARVSMNRASEVDDLGRVLLLSEEELIFPVPVVVNVAGYRTAAGDHSDTLPSASASEAPQIMDGMEKQFDRQATLKPEKSMAVAANLPISRARTLSGRQRKQNRQRPARKPSHAS